MLFQRNSPAFAALSGLLATATLLASFGPSATRALSLDDIPSSCHSQCSQSVSLLNSCGLDTDGSNADSGNISCFCDGYGNSGYDSCSSCIRDHRDDGDDDNSQEDYTDRQNDGDDDDYRKRARRLARRDLLGNLLNIHNDLCLVNGVVSTATSIVGDVTSLAVSVVTDILDGTTTTRTTSSSRSSSDDDEGKYDRPTATVTAYATETVRSAAGRKVTGCKGMVTAIVAAVGLLSLL